MRERVTSQAGRWAAASAVAIVIALYLTLHLRPISSAFAAALAALRG